MRRCVKHQRRKALFQAVSRSKGALRSRIFGCSCSEVVLLPSYRPPFSCFQVRRRKGKRYSRATQQRAISCCGRCTRQWRRKQRRARGVGKTLRRVFWLLICPLSPCSCIKRCHWRSWRRWDSARRLSVCALPCGDMADRKGVFSSLGWATIRRKSNATLPLFFYSCLSLAFSSSSAVRRLPAVSAVSPAEKRLSPRKTVRTIRPGRGVRGGARGTGR